MSVQNVMGWYLMATSVIGSSSGAPLQPHPDNPHYFLYRGKPAVLITSEESYGAVLNLDFDYVPYLDTLAQYGFNKTRVFSGTYHETGSWGSTEDAQGPDQYITPFIYTERHFHRAPPGGTLPGHEGCGRPAIRHLRPP